MDTEPEKGRRPIRVTRSYKKAKQEASETPEPVERATEKKAKVIRKKGMLANLPNLPMDVLFEILGHMAPYDLLKLSRTHKEFRKLLLNKSCRSIWKSALSHVPGLPPCPRDMSEVAYANLAFSPYCFACLTHTKSIIWRLRVRFCGKCAKDKLARLGRYPTSAIFLSQTPRAKLQFMQLMNDLIPNTISKKGLRMVIPSALDDLTEEYFAVPEDQRSVFVEERRQYIAERIKHADLCEVWANTQAQDRGAELRQLREDRKMAIETKLQDLGLGDELRAIERPDSLAEHKLVDRPQRLTEKIWANIKPGIMEFMGEMREKRLKREFDVVLFARKLVAMDVLIEHKQATVDEKVLMPSPVDFCEIPAIRAVLHQAVEIDVNRESFQPLVPQLPTLIEEWRSSLRLALCKKVEAEFPGKDSSATVELATTVFLCGKCHTGGAIDAVFSGRRRKDLLFYPQVQGHRCLSYKVAWMEGHTGDPTFQTASPFTKRAVWDGEQLLLSPSAHNTARELVAFVGLDPSTTTVEEMDNLAIRFHCQACIDRPFGQCSGPLLNWRAAITHLYAAHKNIKVNSALKKFQVEDIADAITSAEREHRTANESIWICLHCQDTKKEEWPLTMSEIVRHMKTAHQKESSPVQGEDFCKHFAALDLQACTPPLQLTSTNGRLEIASQKINPFDLMIDEDDFHFGGIGGFMFDYGSDLDDFDDDGDGDGYGYGLF